MLHNEQNVEECDATGDDSSNTVGYKNINSNYQRIATVNDVSIKIYGLT